MAVPPEHREFARRAEDARLVDPMPTFEALSATTGVPVETLTHLALAWCTKNPRVSTVILGASRISQLEDNLKALDAIPKLTHDVLARIEEIVKNRPAGPEDFT